MLRRVRLRQLNAPRAIHPVTKRCTTLALALSLPGEPTYRLSRGDRAAVRPSRLVVYLKDMPAFESGFTVARVDSSSFGQSWTPVWGETRSIGKQYGELAITLQQAAVANRTLVLRFRLFDDGLGFRHYIARTCRIEVNGAPELAHERDPQPHRSLGHVSHPSPPVPAQHSCRPRAAGSGSPRSRSAMAPSGDVQARDFAYPTRRVAGQASTPPRRRRRNRRLLP